MLQRYCTTCPTPPLKAIPALTNSNIDTCEG